MKIKIKNLFRMPLLAVALVLATVVIVSAATRIHSTLRAIDKTNQLSKVTNSNYQASETSSASVLQQSPARANLEGEVVTLRPSGFQPKQITRPAGPFLLLIENDSQVPSLTLRLSRQVGPQLRAVSVRREERDWSDIVDLPPGNYVVTEASHPAWACHITIQ